MAMSHEALQHEFETLRREAVTLAGARRDLARRATTYHHLYFNSYRNHVFPLIAAHGALWARKHFQLGIRLGQCLAWQHFASPQRRQELLRQLDEFADAFREINRLVCVETYTAYFLVERFSREPAIEQMIRPTLLAALRQVHDARQSEVELPDDVKREIFTAHFLDEQERVVGPRIAEALENFDWPLMKSLALRPKLQFAYFPGAKVFRFQNFANVDERIERGLSAFDLAAKAGWDHVESALAHYDVLPKQLFTHPKWNFEQMRRTPVGPFNRIQPLTWLNGHCDVEILVTFPQRSRSAYR